MKNEPESESPLARRRGGVMGAGAPPIDVGAADTSVALAELLARASRRLRRGSMAQLTPLGITVAQARVLRVIAEAEASLRMADIAARLEVVPRSVTSMIDALEAGGLVIRTADPADRRSVLVELSAAGRDLLARLDRARREGAEQTFGSLSALERDELHRLLAALCDRGECRRTGGTP